ncbi:patatin-like phospholipase family protein [Solimicrobium silvestre]|uniref:Patatin phospholipase n=1 Tax=Solimicrobium silvestre TaxID=2099400 RepID=A0A2S9GV07_9BURK|nr:patatin-like phospholipase family protein [Solimicrobium silvestre]PRC91541.1 Patatin phospholipase [Solimicrobium silvestre]
MTSPRKKTPAAAPSSKSTVKSPRHNHPPALDHEHIVLVLQGGGALGAYQAGVFEALAKIPSEPNWVAGVSIGSINAALIVGNEPHRRVARLQEFWELVTSRSNMVAPMFGQQWSTLHQMGASMAASFGVPGFYKPRVPPPMFQPEGTDAAISYYDTTPLRETLERLIDFDLINSGRVRLSLGAVNVRTGNSEYFDNTKQIIGPDHVMASGALPPAFAPIMIDGEPYWDGGIVSNTPLQYVLDNRGLKKTMAVQVDLFSARGAMPLNMGSVLSRQKDIQYSSRTRMGTDKAAELQRSKQAVQRLIAKLPASMHNDPEVKHLMGATRTAHLDIVHLIYRQDRYELESKDYEFSRPTMQAHWEAGLRDMQRTLDHPDWLQMASENDGVTVYDLAHTHCSDKE